MKIPQFLKQWSVSLREISRRGAKPPRKKLITMVKFFLYGVILTSVLTLSYAHQIIFSGKKAFEQITAASTPLKHLAAMPKTNRPPEPEADERVNILLLGTGGVEHEGADLTDNIMLISFKTK